MTTPAFIFDFALDPGAARTRLSFGEPREVLRADRLDDVKAVLAAAEERARAGAWVAGMVAYEAAPAFDPVLRVRPAGDMPLAWFAVLDAPRREAAPARRSPDMLSSWTPSIGRERFDSDIAAIRRAIGDGEAYQVNHTFRLHSRYAGDAPALFERLRAVQACDYAAYLDLGRWQILSLSPELFFRRDGATLTARPMKGTARRGLAVEEDLRLADQLRASEKNRAENLMIVDLLRNDLSRVALPRSVKVPQLFAIERYPTLLQMTSTVTAEARPDAGLADIFAALFPCGSVTGAPKAAAMKIIAARETEPRGVYCGAVGLLKPGGDAVFNVAIRTVAIDRDSGTASCGVGGGIVWDSTAGDEYAEALLKARFLSAEASEFDLLETLRLEDGRYVRLDLHLARMASSAAHFCRPFDAAACRARLGALAAEAGPQPLRVRLRLEACGALEITTAPLPPAAAAPLAFALADHPVSRDSLWLYHKTTRREAFERATAARREVFDVLLWNEDGELTEFTRGNVVLDLDGRLLTPRRDSGLLDGCLRRELLDRGEIAEAVLHRDDLARASRVWFINSLRGWVEVRPAEPPQAPAMRVESAAR